MKGVSILVMMKLCDEMIVYSEGFVMMVLVFDIFAAAVLCEIEHFN